MLALQAPDDEMAAREGLEMVGEGGVDRRAADRAENRRRLCGQLLADDDAETRGDLRDEPRHERHRMSAEPLLRDKARAVAHRFGERGANREIAAFEHRLLVLLPPSANTSTQAKAAFGALRSSPSSRAISAIERNSMVVEIGSSTSSAASAERAAERAGGGGSDLMGAIAGLGGRVEVDRA